MKIIKVEPIMTGWRRMFVKVYTDEGSYAKRQNAMSKIIHAVREAVGLELDIGCEIHRSLNRMIILIVR